MIALLVIVDFKPHITSLYSYPRLLNTVLRRASEAPLKGYRIELV